MSAHGVEGTSAVAGARYASKRSTNGTRRSQQPNDSGGPNLLGAPDVQASGVRRGEPICDYALAPNSGPSTSSTCNVVAVQSRTRSMRGCSLRYTGAGALDELLCRQLQETRQLAEKHEAEIEAYLQIDLR